MKKLIISESEKQRILEMHQNATSRQYLNEAVQSVILTLNIPTVQGQIDRTKNIPFSIGPLGKNAANEYTGILTNMTINGQLANKLTNQKLTGEYVNGEIMPGTDPDLLISAINGVKSNDLIDQSLLNRYSATFVRKKDPSNPSSPGQQNIFIQKIIKNLKPAQNPK
jgi:hypothetical protein